MGVAGAIIVLVFEDKLKELRRKGRSPFLLAIAALLIVASLAIINSRIVDFVIPIPVPAIQIPATVVPVRQALVQACMLGSMVVLFPLFIVWSYTLPTSEPLFGNLYQQILMCANTILVLTKTPLFIGRMNTPALVAFGVLGAASFCLRVDAMRQAQRELEAELSHSPSPRIGFLRRIARGLAVTIMWTAAILEAWS